MEEHVEHRYDNASKCAIVKKTVGFPRPQITGSGIIPTEANSKVVRERATPKDVKDLKSFFAFSNYSQKIITNFAAAANPLF